MIIEKVLWVYFINYCYKRSLWSKGWLCRYKQVTETIYISIKVNYLINYTNCAIQLAWPSLEGPPSCSPLVFDILLPVAEAHQHCILLHSLSLIQIYIQIFSLKLLQSYHHHSSICKEKRMSMYILFFLLIVILIGFTGNVIRQIYMHANKYKINLSILWQKKKMA